MSAVGFAPNLSPPSAREEMVADMSRTTLAIFGLPPQQQKIAEISSEPLSAASGKRASDRYLVSSFRRTESA